MTPRKPRKPTSRPPINTVELPKHVSYQHVDPTLIPALQCIDKDDVHVQTHDVAGQRVDSVPQAPAYEVARQVRAEQLDRLGSRYGLPGVLILIVTLKLLGIDVAL